MKTKRIFKITTLMVSVVLLTFFYSCDKKTTEPEEHELEITLKYTPNPATVGTPITFIFEVEENGEHKAVTMYSCEVHMEGSEFEMELEEEEAGHYKGVHTFTEAGTYEMHFEYMHDDKMDGKEFEVTINE